MVQYQVACSCTHDYVGNVEMCCHIVDVEQCLDSVFVKLSRQVQLCTHRVVVALFRGFWGRRLRSNLRRR